MKKKVKPYSRFKIYLFSLQCLCVLLVLIQIPHPDSAFKPLLWLHYSDSNVFDEVEVRVAKLAILETNVTLLESILEFKSNKNPYMNEKTQQTLLHYLAWKTDNVKLFETLAKKLENLEDVFVKDIDGDFPVDVAVKKGHYNIVKYITSLVNVLVVTEEHEYDKWKGITYLQNALQLACENNHYTVFGVLLTNILSMNYPNVHQVVQLLQFINSLRDKSSYRINTLIDKILREMSEVNAQKLKSTCPKKKKCQFC